MIVQADSIAQDARLRADVCIVGGGAAGISMALSLTGKGLSIIVLESGGLRADAATQALGEGEVADEQLHSPPHRYRQRGLGGSTAIWGGRCMPLDPIDFEERAYVPHSGWPIGDADLLPFYPAANALAEAGRFSYDAREALPGSAPLIAGFSSDIVRTDGLERFSCPTNFGRRYQQRLTVAPDLRVLLGANCTAIRLDPGATTVREVEVSTLAGRRFRVAARTVVLAAGGLETARLLLCSNDVEPAGVGNRFDVVGRYYMCHIAGNVGTLTVRGGPQAVRHGYEISADGIYCRRRLSITAAGQRRHALLNAVARLHFPKITDPSHRNGVLSGLFLSRSLISYEYGKRLKDTAPTSASGYARHMLNVAGDPIDTAAFLAHWLRRRTLAERKFPSVILRNRSNRFSLEVQSEQQPLASSRVRLGDKVDALGMRQLHVDWRYSQDDIRSVQRTLDIIASELRASGAGEFDYRKETLEEDLMRYGAYGGHHIGTARMGTDPRSSVVDADCKVHSVDNLFVAGSAAFPTSSQANPTLTLIALSLRLADRLARKLQVRMRAPAELVA
jgi:choline dehydrogenase-like flavoprotein